jgi:succinate dehydrogenase / fumarate reductase, flavoprotein subunit
LMQGLADGYFIVPATVPSYIASYPVPALDTSHPAFESVRADVERRTAKLLAINGTRSADSFLRQLGKIVWDDCGMARSDASIRHALGEIKKLHQEFWRDLRVLGTGEELNQSLEKAGRVADFFELAELLCIDALQRTESCGGHFRIESQTPEGDALRDDANFSYCAAWEYQGEGAAPVLHKEPLVFEYVHLAQRSYK